MSCESPWQSKRLSYGSIVSYDGAKPYRTATLWQVTQELCGSEGSATLTFWVFIHLQRILQTHQEWGWTGCHWNVWNYRNEGTPNDAYLRFLLISNMIVDFMYVFSMMTAQHIRNYKKNQHIWNSLAPRKAGVVKRLPFRVFSSPQDQLRASELRSSGGNNFSQAEVDELSILFHEGPPTDESEQWKRKTPQLLACWLFLPTQNGSKMMLLDVACHVVSNIAANS